MGFAQFQSLEKKRQQEAAKQAAKPILMKGVQTAPQFNQIQSPASAIPHTLSTQPVTFQAPKATPKAATPQGIALNTLKGIPQALSQQVGQPALRGYAALGGYLAAGPFAQARKADTAFHPTGQFQQQLLGTDKPITFQSVGNEALPQSLQNSKFAPALGVGLSIADAVPGGSPARAGLKSILHPEDITFAESAIKAIKNNTISDQAWTTLQNMFKAYKQPIPSSKRVAAEYLTQAFKNADVAAENKAFQNLDANAQAYKPTTQTTQQIVAQSTTKPAPQQQTGTLKFIKDTITGKLNGSGYSKGAIKNPFASEPTPPRGTGLPQDLPEQRSPTSQPPADLSPRQSLSLENDLTTFKKNPAVNLSKMDISSKGKELITQEAEAIKPRIQAILGKTLSNNEVIKNAEATASVVQKAVGRDQTKDMVTAVLKTRQKLAALAESGTVDKEFIETLATVRSLASDAGRKLQAFSIEAKPAEVTLKQFLSEQLLDLGHSTDEILKASEGVDFNDFKQASAFYRQFVKPSVPEMLDLLRYNSMLSSPLTHIVNITSNLINSSIIAPIEKITATGFDFLSSKIAGTERTRTLGEAGAYLKGYYSNLGEASHKFLESIRGNTPVTNLDTRQIPLATSKTGKAIENTIAAPLKLLEAADQFFTSLTKAAETSALSHRAAKGIKVDDFQTKVTTEALYRLYRQDLNVEGQGALLKAVDAVTSLVQNARNAKSAPVRLIARFTIPFLKTPTNIFKQGLEYSPLGLMNLAGGADKPTILARAAIGTALGATAGMLLASNRMTWSEPRSEKEKNAFKAAGMQPYSIKLGDTWVSFQKLPPPLAFPLSMAAAINDLIQNKELDENTGSLILHAIAKYGNFLSDQSYAKSLGDLVAAINGEESSVAKLASNYPQQLIPYRALGGWLARLTDHVQRKPDPEGNYIDKQVQLLMMNIPGLSDNVPARTDENGNPIQAPNPILNSFSPVRTSPEDKGKTDQFNKIMDIKHLEQKATAEHDLLKQQAEDIVTEFDALPKSEADQRFRELKRSNPALADKVKDLKDQQRIDYSPDEKALKSASVEARAQFIAKELKGIKDKQERNQRAAYYKKIKILTQATDARVKELLKQ